VPCRAAQSSRFALETLSMQWPQTAVRGDPWGTQTWARAEMDDEIRLIDQADLTDAVASLDLLGLLNRPLASYPHVVALSRSQTVMGLSWPWTTWPAMSGVGPCGLRARFVNCRIPQAHRSRPRAVLTKPSSFDVFRMFIGESKKIQFLWSNKL
jgi:hypothetical protein